MTVPIPADAWSTAMPDWADRILAGESLVPKLPLFDPVADKALRIFKRLRMPDITGNPTYGECCGQWVFDFVRAIFGAYDPETKRRMIQEFFLLVPKKNGKSAIAAAIMVTALILNERPECELWLVAPRKKVAIIAYKQAMGIIRLDAELLATFHCQEQDHKITHRITKAYLVVMAADLKVVTGCKAAYVLVDELHEFATMSKASDMMIELKGGLAARPDGFFLTITTQSKNPPAGVFKAELEKARAVREGRVALPLLPVLYELPVELTKDGGWKRPETWGLVNPALGAAVQEHFLAAALIAAEEAGADALALLASQHFNVQPGTAAGATIWPGARFWDAAADDKLETLADLIARCDVAVVGVDGGGLDDLFGLAVIGREKGSKRWLHWAKGWAFPEVMTQRPEIAPRLQDFIDADELTLCEYVGQDVEEACDIIQELEDAGLLPDKTPAIGLDVHGIAELLDGLEERGFDAERFVSVGQGYKLQSAVLTLPRKLKDKTMLHCGSPIMSWNVGNAKTELRGSNYLVTKSVAGSAKIDLLIATFNAGMLMLNGPEPKRKVVHKVFFV